MEAHFAGSDQIGVAQPTKPVLANDVRLCFDDPGKGRLDTDQISQIDHGRSDDLLRLRTDQGPQNMATIKHIAMNLIRRAPGKDSRKTRRKAAAWNHDDLKDIFTAAA